MQNGDKALPSWAGPGQIKPWFNYYNMDTLSP